MTKEEALRRINLIDAILYDTYNPVLDGHLIPEPLRHEIRFLAEGIPKEILDAKRPAYQPTEAQVRRRAEMVAACTPRQKETP